MEKIRRKLAGTTDGDRQMVKILAAVLEDGLPAVETACAEALAEGVYSADVIINILARRRDPGPPLTILTPDALKLRHMPLAGIRILSVPKGCSAVSRRTRIACGISSRRCCTASSTCSHRV